MSLNGTVERQEKIAFQSVCETGLAIDEHVGWVTVNGNEIKLDYDRCYDIKDFMHETNKVFDKRYV